MQFAKVENCLVCSASVQIKENPEIKLEDFMKRLRIVHGFKSPSILAGEETWYHPIMKSQLAGNLEKTLEELCKGNCVICWLVLKVFD